MYYLYIFAVVVGAMCANGNASYQYVHSQLCGNEINQASYCRGGEFFRSKADLTEYCCAMCPQLRTKRILFELNIPNCPNFPKSSSEQVGYCYDDDKKAILFQVCGCKNSCTCPLDQPHIFVTNRTESMTLVCKQTPITRTYQVVGEFVPVD